MNQLCRWCRLACHAITFLRMLNVWFGVFRMVCILIGNLSVSTMVPRIKPLKFWIALPLVMRVLKCIGSIMGVSPRLVICVLSMHMENIWHGLILMIRSSRTFYTELFPLWRMNGPTIASWHTVKKLAQNATQWQTVHSLGKGLRTLCSANGRRQRKWRRITSVFLCTLGFIVSEVERHGLSGAIFSRRTIQRTGSCPIWFHRSAGRAWSGACAGRSV